MVSGQSGKYIYFSFFCSIMCQRQVRRYQDLGLEFQVKSNGNIMHENLSSKLLSTTEMSSNGSEQVIDMWWHACDLLLLVYTRTGIYAPQRVHA